VSRNQEKKPTLERAERVFGDLRRVPIEPAGDHLTEKEFAEYGTEALSLEEAKRIDLHLSSCESCVNDMMSRMEIAAFWETPEGLARIEKGRKILFSTVESLTFARHDDSAILKDHQGVTIPDVPEERNLVSSLLKFCRAIARGGYIPAPTGALADPLRIRSGHLEWPALHRYDVLESDNLPPTAAYAIREGDGFRVVVLVLLNRGRYSLEVLLVGRDENPLTEGKISWNFKNSNVQHTLRVSTGAELITTAREGTIEMLIEVIGSTPMRLAIVLT